MAENLFIQIRNGGPFEHPVTESNLRLFYPDFDDNNPPEGFVRFIRNPEPSIGPFQTLVGAYYEKVDGVWQDVYHIRDLTPVEKAQKITSIKKEFPFSDTWTLDENTLKWEPPVKYPEDGNKYYWDNVIRNWLRLPESNTA
jgi:hypothetical protein